MEKKSRAQQVAEQLYSRIVVVKGLRPGEKLPNEVDLAGEVGVNRGHPRGDIGYAGV